MNEPIICKVGSYNGVISFIVSKNIWNHNHIHPIVYPYKTDGNIQNDMIKINGHEKLFEYEGFIFLSSVPILNIYSFIPKDNIRFVQIAELKFETESDCWDYISNIVDIPSEKENPLSWISIGKEHFQK